MNEFLAYFLNLLPSLIIGIILFSIQRKILRRENISEHRLEDRKRENLLQLKLQMANSKLSFAVAMALKNGKINGEVDEAISEYEDAKKEYHQFLNEQAIEYFNRDI